MQEHADPRSTVPSGTFPVTSAVELAVVERGGFVESRHAGSAIVLAPDGTVLRSLGDPDAPVFPRSAMKPFQALAVLAQGVRLEGVPLALAMASHTGTPAHRREVAAMLASVGLDESALRCPAAWPIDSASRSALEHPSPLAMECSGKHAAMLMACVRNGWGVEDYLEPDHPLQQRILDVVERMTGVKVVASGPDGCGAPVHAMSLDALARGIQRIGIAADSSPFALYRNAAHLRRAVLEHAWAASGPGRPDQVVIDGTGAFVKHGAEGVLVAAAPDGTTVALKVLDGSPRVGHVVALTLLVQAGALPAARVAAVLKDLDLAVRGGGAVVGSIRPTVRV